MYSPNSSQSQKKFYKLHIFAEFLHFENMVFKREQSLLTLLEITFFSFLLPDNISFFCLHIGWHIGCILVAILVNLLFRAYQIEIKVHLTSDFQVPHFYWSTITAMADFLSWNFMTYWLPHWYIYYFQPTKIKTRVHLTIDF